jgi:hypothetical protein
MIQLLPKASIGMALLSLLWLQVAAAQPEGIRLGSAHRHGGLSASVNSRPASPISSGHATHASSPNTFPPYHAAQQEPSLRMWEEETLSPSLGHCVTSTCDGFDACLSPTGNWLLDWSRSDLSIGLVGFQGGGDFLQTMAVPEGESAGNFGLQGAFNFGSQLPSVFSGELGAQFGVRFTHTNLDGSRVADDHRSQLFLTTGLYRRVDCGLQGGLVIDYLHEDWLYQADLLQLRGELSWLLATFQDFGFRFTDSCQTDSTTAVTRHGSTSIRLAARNTYRFFYRHPIGERGGGTAEWQVGFSENSQALLGLQLQTPLAGEVGLQTVANYLIPDSSRSVAYREEGWNLGIAMVWTPGRRFGAGRDYYRPLFDVADNGSLFITGR